MGRRIALGLGLIVALGLLVAACGSSKTTAAGPGGGDGGEGGEAGGTATICVPFSKRCAGLDIIACNALGQAESLDTTCATGLRCVEEAGTAHCDTRVCTPGQPLCDGNVATVCAADGGGPKSGGTSCKSAVCENGACVPVECEPGSRMCKNGALLSCGDDGASIARVDNCTSSQVCDSDQGKCLPRVCMPDQPSCDGTVAKTCNAFGSGYLPDPVDCADDSLQCVAGKCSKQICIPVQRSCKDDNVVQCNLTGDELVLQQTCVHEKEHCEDFSGGFASCYADVCTAGKVGCDKNAVKTCNDAGYYPADGEDCGDGWCADGACHAKTCNDGEYFCQGSDIYLCLFQEPPLLQQSCAAGQVCRSAGMPSAAFCGEPDCTPGATTCLKNQIGKCASDGATLSQVTSDCGADSTICTVEPKCAAKAVDTLGADESVQPLYQDTFIGDVIEVTSARTLTQLSANLSFPNGRQLRWVIYEQAGSAFIAKVDKVASVTSASGAVTSPAFNFQLQAGKTYLVGLVVTGGDVLGTYYDSAPYEAHVSFGTILGMFAGGYSATYASLDSFVYDTVFYLEVTTTP
jgi:hypothetical protein